ncbi:hypothetical protein Ancab_036671 [Ancistrocladus abbreviatus]
MDGPPQNDCCSICHGNFNVPCQANCSHWFCGRCILRAWHHGSALQPCRCPLCRRAITLLIPDEASQQQCDIQEVGRVVREIKQYNRSFGKRPSGIIQVRLFSPGSGSVSIQLKIILLLDESAKRDTHMLMALWRSTVDAYDFRNLVMRLQDLPFLLRRLLHDLVDPQRSLPVVIKARVFLAMLLSVIYLLSPVDIIPEGILGIIGFLDDLIILLICVLHVAAVYRSALVYRHGGS